MCDHVDVGRIQSAPVYRRRPSEIDVAVLLARAHGSAVNARDRIGQGPWHNATGVRIAQNLADLHGDTLDQARMGNVRLGIGALARPGLDLLPAV